MKEKLTIEEKYQLLDIKPESFCEKMKHMFLKEFYTVSKGELIELRDAVGQAIEIDVERVDKDEPSTRIAFRVLDDKVVRIKWKGINLKILQKNIDSIFSVWTGNRFMIMVTVIKVLFSLFVEIFEDEEAFICTFLCREKFHNNITYNNVEIFTAINHFMKEMLDTELSIYKINVILSKLENAKIIELDDGFVKVKEKVF